MTAPPPYWLGPICAAAGGLVIVICLACLLLPAGRFCPRGAGQCPALHGHGGSAAAQVIRQLGAPTRPSMRRRPVPCSACIDVWLMGHCCCSGNEGTRRTLPPHTPSPHYWAQAHNPTSSPFRPTLSPAHFLACSTQQLQGLWSALDRPMLGLWSPLDLSSAFFRFCRILSTSSFPSGPLIWPFAALLFLWRPITSTAGMAEVQHATGDMKVSGQRRVVVGGGAWA